jgi:hypothetical protein
LKAATSPTMAKSETTFFMISYGTINRPFRFSILT